MKRLLLTAAAMAAVVAPSLSMAQNREVRRDQREVQQSQRELQAERREALRDGRIDRGDRGEIREAQRELRDDRRELREDRRDMRQDDRRAQRWDRSNRDWWRGRVDFRGYNGARAGMWYAPGYGYVRSLPGFAGHNWRRGQRVPPAYRNYAVNDYGYYGLRAPPPGHRYVYLGNNIVLMSLATGLIADTLLNIY